jgi:hypothetical protein
MKILKIIIRIYKIIIRIGEYIDFRKIANDFKGKNEMEKRDDILRRKHRRNNKKE